MREVATYAGDTYRITYRLQQPNGQPVDLTGAQAAVVAKRNGIIVPIAADTTISGLDGTIALRMVMPDAADRYVVTVRVTYPNGDRITIDRCVLAVLEA